MCNKNRQPHAPSKEVPSWTLSDLFEAIGQLPPEQDVLYSKYVPLGTVYTISLTELKKESLLPEPFRSMLYDADEMVIIGTGGGDLK